MDSRNVVPRTMESSKGDRVIAVHHAVSDVVAKATISSRPASLPMKVRTSRPCWRPFPAANLT